MAIRIVFTFATLALIVKSMFDHDLSNQNRGLVDVFAVLVGLYSLLAWIGGVNLVILPGPVDAVMALIHVRDQRITPALIRGLNYRPKSSYVDYPEAIQKELSYNISYIKDFETVMLDPITRQKLIRRLQSICRFGSRISPNSFTLATELIAMPGIADDPAIRRCLERLAVRKSKNSDRATLQTAAWNALDMGERYKNSIIDNH